MKPLNYLDDITNIDFSKSYLLIHVDECSISTPFINTGKEIVQHLIEKLSEQTEVMNNVVEELGFDVKDLLSY